jgi:hypothetical protein
MDMAIGFDDCISVKKKRNNKNNNNQKTKPKNQKTKNKNQKKKKQQPNQANKQTNKPCIPSKIMQLILNLRKKNRLTKLFRSNRKFPTYTTSRTSSKYMAKSYLIK